MSTETTKHLPAKPRLARNIRAGMQILSDATGEWLDVTSAMRVEAAGIKIVRFVFADGTSQAGSPTFRVMSR